MALVGTSVSGAPPPPQEAPLGGGLPRCPPAVASGRTREWRMLGKGRRAVGERARGGNEEEKLQIGTCTLPVAGDVQPQDLLEGRGRRRGGVVHSCFPLSLGKQQKETCIHQGPVYTRIRFFVRIAVRGRIKSVGVWSLAPQEGLFGRLRAFSQKGSGLLRGFLCLRGRPRTLLGRLGDSPF